MSAINILKNVTTGTITTMLLKKDIRRGFEWLYPPNDENKKRYEDWKKKR